MMISTWTTPMEGQLCRDRAAGLTTGSSLGPRPGERKVAPVDAVDARILAELQADSRLSQNEVSRRVNLSAPAVAERIRRLGDAGVIRGYAARIDPAAVGRPVQAFVQLDCYGSRCVLKDPAVLDWPEVLELHRITGDACSLLRIAVADMAEFQELIDRLARYGKPTSSLLLASPLAWKPVQPR
jgi:Lrp/AsnC family leucine-responsive transcriptional regulator